MEINFEQLDDIVSTGKWITKVRKSDGKKFLYCDGSFRKMLSVPDDITGSEELFNYWYFRIDEKYKELLDAFFASWKNGLMNFEHSYLWNSPPNGQMYFRDMGKIMETNDEYIIYRGITQDITDTYYFNDEYAYQDFENGREIFELKNQISNLLETIGTVVEFRNMESDTHVRCVKIFTEIIAQYVSEHYPEYRLDAQQVKIIASASPLHDIGKIAVSEMILLKPGRLTREEFEMMKTHSKRGYEIISSLKTFKDSMYKRYCGEIAYYHHERYDGNGYPEGLKGDEIPISAQIVSLADVYDALITPRVYKESYTIEQAYEMIMMGECGEFNPKLIEALKNVRPKIERIAKKYKLGEYCD